MELGPAGLAAAFAAGFVSFVSPCVLPLVPGYLSFVSRVGLGELEDNRKRVLAASLGFVAGFTVMFVLLGAGAALIGDALLRSRRTLEIVAGIFVVFAGLVFMRVPLPVTAFAEKRFHVARGAAGRATPVLFGAAFAVGWTPCIGPTLAAILALAAAGGSPARGAALLAVYSLGLGVPFVLFGLAFTRALGTVTLLRRHMRVITMASGALLVLFGILLATGELQRLTSGLARFTGLSI